MENKAEMDYALEERAKGMAIKMYAYLLVMQHASPELLVALQPQIQEVVNKIEGKQ